MTQLALRQSWFDGQEMIPRFREIGDITLDLFHRDGRVEDQWLNFFPREFELIWRLAEEPGKPVSRLELLEDVWRIHHLPDTNSVAVHVARVRARLKPFGLTDLLRTGPNGSYLLQPAPSPGAFHFPKEES